MINRLNPIAGLAVLLFFAAGQAPAEEGRIYGRIHTDRGDVLEGAIRWDKNEASWDDIIDGNKERTKTHNKHGRRRYRDDNTRVKIFGLTIYDEGGWGLSAQSGVAFGHVEELYRDNDDEVELLLKSGEKVILHSGSTDFGYGIREIVIEDKTEGELELDWGDIDYIEFFDGGDVESNFGNRLYGTVTTSRGGEFTGWICWDMDEMFEKDILDGSDRGRKRKIKFSKIARIERISSRASKIVTKNGEELRLDDSNDVDSGNRGIIISDLKLGRVVVEWDEFESLDLTDPPGNAHPKYSDFDGGRRLYGTAYNEEGDQHTGYIRWDDDEEFTWELLDGDYRGVEFDIVFANIRSIEKLSRRSSRVTLTDGRSYRLRGSNDVDDDNKGIIIQSDPEDEDTEIYIDWDDFDRVEFSRK